MDYQVPVLSVVFMIATMLAGIALPVGLFIYLRKKYGCKPMVFFTGVLVMLVFALILEQIVHYFVLTSAFGIIMQSNIWAYGFYGGLMAGLFEETGRFIAFGTILKNKRGNNANALMYGAGHGGFEAFYLLFIGMLNNVIYSIMLNTGNISSLTGSLSAASLATLQSSLATLAATPPPMFLVGILERLAALAAQLSLSVIVWFAAKNKGKSLLFFPLAIVLHMLLDAGAVILNSYVQSIFITELFIWLFAAGCVFIAVKVYKTNLSNPNRVDSDSRLRV